MDGPVLGPADRAAPAASLLGPEVLAVSREILALDGLDAMTALAETYLLGLPALLPDAEPDPVVAEVVALVERITASPQLFRVDELARELDLPVRRLQRLFAEYVGAGPGGSPMPKARGGCCAAPGCTRRRPARTTARASTGRRSRRTSGTPTTPIAPGTSRGRWARRRAGTRAAESGSACC